MDDTKNLTTDRAWWRVVDKLNLGLAFVAGIACVLLVVHIVANVAVRWLTRVPLPGTLDITTYIWMPIVCILGMGYALQRSEHVRVSLITSPASKRTQFAVEVGSLLLSVVLIGALVYYTYIGALDAFAIGESATANPWLIIWPIRFLMVAGLAGFFLQGVVELFRSIARTSAPEPREVAL